MVYPAFTLAIAAAAMSPGPAAPSFPSLPPSPPTSGASGHLRPSIEALILDYQGQAETLRAEMAALKKSDGGQLTPEHLAYVQEKLIVLLDAYRSDLRKDDPMSVNADGTLRR